MFVTRYAVWYVVVGSLSAAVLDDHFPYLTIWVICDGYVVYDRFCRQAEIICRHPGGRAAWLHIYAVGD